jgi:hypothetical protein
MRPCRDRARLRQGALAMALLAIPAATLAQAPAAAEAKGALVLARVSLVERKVELEKRGASWQAAVEGGPLSVGEALRTGPDAVARLELPWMALTLSATRRCASGRVPAAGDTRERAGARRITFARGVEGRHRRGGSSRAGPRGRPPAGRSTLVTCLRGASSSQRRLGRDPTPGRGAMVDAGRARGPAGRQRRPRNLWPAGRGLRRTGRVARELR